MSKIGLKIVREDDGSLTDDYGRVFYPMGEWVDVPGIGAFVAISGGLFNAGDGPKCIYLECEGEGEDSGSPGVLCFKRVRQIPPCPEKLDPNLRELVRLWEVPLDLAFLLDFIQKSNISYEQMVAVSRLKSRKWKLKFAPNGASFFCGAFSAELPNNRGEFVIRRWERVTPSGATNHFNLNDWDSVVDSETVRYGSENLYG